MVTEMKLRSSRQAILNFLIGTLTARISQAVDLSRISYMKQSCFKIMLFCAMLITNWKIVSVRFLSRNQKLINLSRTYKAKFTPLSNNSWKVDARQKGCFLSTAPYALNVYLVLKKLESPDTFFQIITWLQLNTSVATGFWRQQLVRIKAELKKITYICIR